MGRIESSIRGIAVVIGLLALSGCGVLIQHSPATLSKQAHVLDVPLQKQTAANLCGVATVNMLTAYYQKPLTSEQEVALRDYAVTHNGLTGNLIRAALTTAGYYAVIYPGTLDHSITGVFTNIDKGRPSIVLLKSTIDGSTHFSILSGYDPSKNYVILTDPVMGTSIMKSTDFMIRWQGAENFTLLALPESAK